MQIAAQGSELPEKNLILFCLDRNNEENEPILQFGFSTICLCKKTILPILLCRYHLNTNGLLQISNSNNKQRHIYIFSLVDLGQRTAIEI